MMEFKKKLKKVPPRTGGAHKIKYARVPKVAAGLIVFLFCGALTGLLGWSVLDTDKTVSESENRTLAARPRVSVSTLLDGTFMSDFETYYADTFPFRDQLLATGKKLNAFFGETRGTQDVILVDKGDKEDFAGQDITYDE